MFAPRSCIHQASCKNVMRSDCMPPATASSVLLSSFFSFLHAMWLVRLTCIHLAHASDLVMETLFVYES